MSIQPFVLGFPGDGSTLGNTKVQIRNNIDGTYLTLGQDHVNNNGDPGSNTPGFHTVIHQTTQSNISTASNINQVFSGIPGTLIVNGVTTDNIPPSNDTQLYCLTGAGSLSQLTGSRDQTSPTNPTITGYQWIGDFLLQWGRTETGGASGLAIVFPQPFPNRCRNLQITNETVTNQIIASGVRTNTLNNLGFIWEGTNTNQLQAIFWLAIGF